MDFSITWTYTLFHNQPIGLWAGDFFLVVTFGIADSRVDISRVMRVFVVLIYNVVGRGFGDFEFTLSDDSDYFQTIGLHFVYDLRWVRVGVVLDV